jgi:peptidyl-tRNA hydrolase
MGERYLKQVIVARRDLTMPAGKPAAMAAHATMTFMLKRLPFSGSPPPGLPVQQFSREQWQWLAGLDPGLEEIGQVSMAKIVCSVADEDGRIEFLSDCTHALAGQTVDLPEM